MQLGCILHTVPSWKQSYKLRVAVFVEYESDVDEERSRVGELLENLRIEAEILVFWLASGHVKSYQVIVNGDSSDGDAEIQVEKVLEDEQWWRDVKRLRGQGKTGEFSAIDDLSSPEEVPWPSSSFQNGRRETSVARFEGLKSLMKLSHRRPSFNNISSLGVSLGMRTSRLNDDMISRHASHASASEASDSDGMSTIGSDTAEEGSSEEGSMGFSESENDTVPPSHRDEVDHLRSSSPISRNTHSKKSSLSSRKSRSSRKKLRPMSGPTATGLSESQIQASDMGSALIDITPAPESPAESDHQPRGRRWIPDNAPEFRAIDSSGSRERLHPDRETRRTSRSSSPAHFSSSPMPTTRIAADDVGPSIMFADDPRPLRDRPAAQVDPDSSGVRSIYQRNVDSKSPPSGSASGFPSSASMPLSFNDLPCRAQHLILNELITQQSEDTAVIFTTLPAPVEGTYKSESDSLGYVSDLEVLCGGLPPSMLVHSNSMTVTMNL